MSSKKWCARCDGKGWVWDVKHLIVWKKRPCPRCKAELKFVLEQAADTLDKTELKYVQETTYGMTPMATGGLIFNKLTANAEAWRWFRQRREIHGDMHHRRN